MASPAWASAIGTGGALGESPLGGLAGSPKEQEEETTASQTSASASESSTSSSGSSSTLVAVGIVGAVLLCGIAFFIVRDARNVAPASDGPPGGMSASGRAAQLRKRRARAKAARRQRKRNR